MAPQKSIWYHLGHVYERARLEAPSKEKALDSLAERSGVERDRSAEPSWPSADDLISAGAMLLLDRVVGLGRRRRRPGVGGLVRAGAAGAAAALLVELVRPLLHGDAELPVLDRDTADRIIAGLGQGLVYGALIEPTVPGPALLKGAVYGSVEYATDPMGGLSKILGANTPQGRIPGVGEYLDALDPHDRAYVEHVVFGIALALLYESSPTSNGIVPDEAEDA